jgi:hypothetical protein
MVLVLKKCSAGSVELHEYMAAVMQHMTIKI